MFESPQKKTLFKIINHSSKYLTKYPRFYWRKFQLGRWISHITYVSYLFQTLKERSDFTQVPSIDIQIKESQPKDNPKPEPIDRIKDNINQNGVFECRIDKLVQQSVNHIFKDKDIDKNRIFPKTLFLTQKVDSEVNSMVFANDIFLPEGTEEECGVLNLSVKGGRRKSHGRKQSAPRRIKTYVFHESDGKLIYFWHVEIILWLRCDIGFSQKTHVIWLTLS